MAVEMPPEVVIPPCEAETATAKSGNLKGVTEAEIAEFAGCEVVSTFGSRLRAARESEGRSKEECSKAANVSRTTITNWEEGIAPRGLTDEGAANLAKLLHVSVAWLMDGAEGESPSPSVAAKAADPTVKEKLRGILRNLRPIVRELEDLTES